jgi:hypothetical protein
MRPRALCGVLAATVLATGCGATATVGPESGSRAGTSRMVEDAGRGYSVVLPEGWYRARRNLTPQLMDPREILSIATYPLRYQRRTRCRIPGCPTPALNGFRAPDILLSIQERLRARPAAKAIPIDLNPHELGPGARQHSCTRGRVAWYAFENFAAAGRTFYVFAVVGERAPAKARQQLDRMLDSLRFTPQRAAPAGFPKAAR